MGLPVKGRVYSRLVDRVRRDHGLSLRELILKRVNEDGVSATELARELAIRRQLLYDYARANGIDLTTKPVAIDVWAQMAASPGVAGPARGASDA